MLKVFFKLEDSDDTESQIIHWSDNLNDNTLMDISTGKTYCFGGIAAREVKPDRLPEHSGKIDLHWDADNSYYFEVPEEHAFESVIPSKPLSDIRYDGSPRLVRKVQGMVVYISEPETIEKKGKGLVLCHLLLRDESGQESIACFGKTLDNLKGIKEGDFICLSPVKVDDKGVSTLPSTTIGRLPDHEVSPGLHSLAAKAEGVVALTVDRTAEDFMSDLHQAPIGVTKKGTFLLHVQSLHITTQPTCKGCGARKVEIDFSDDGHEIIKCCIPTCLMETDTAESRLVYGGYLRVSNPATSEQLPFTLNLSSMAAQNITGMTATGWESAGADVKAAATQKYRHADIIATVTAKKTPGGRYYATVTQLAKAAVADQPFF